MNRTHSTEYAHYLQFFAIWDLFDKVAETQFSESSHTTKGAKESWLNGYKVCFLSSLGSIFLLKSPLLIKTLLDDLREKASELLTTEWLVNEDVAAQIGMYRILSSN